MILVDTSIWIDHLRYGNDALKELLGKLQVLCHPFILGELSCGNLKNRRQVLSLLRDLPSGQVAEDSEVMELVEARRLMGQSIGWIDAHLLASALLSGSPLWTSDKKLRSVTAALGVLY